MQTQLEIQTDWMEQTEDHAVMQVFATFEFMHMLVEALWPYRNNNLNSVFLRSDFMIS